MKILQYKGSEKSKNTLIIKCENIKCIICMHWKYAIISSRCKRIYKQGAEAKYRIFLKRILYLVSTIFYEKKQTNKRQ